VVLPDADKNATIPGGTLGEDGESLFFALDSGYYREMERRAEMVVAAGKATWGGPEGVSLQKARQNPAIMEAAVEEAAAYTGLLRRKNANVWQTRLMIERTSLNAGHFEHPLLAAIAYDFAQTFLRPTLRNSNGTSIGLNFTDTASDTRIVPVTLAQGLTPIYLEKPGVPLEEGHFWAKDEVYYAEIKARAKELEQQCLAPANSNNSTVSGELLYVGIQRHRRKPPIAAAAAATAAPEGGWGGIAAAAATPCVASGGGEKAVAATDGGANQGGGETSGGTFTWEGKLIHRRKWFYLGRFKTQLEAAVS